jgi:DNA-directed RNA polymerase subunit RPC12/RpoP
MTDDPMIEWSRLVAFVNGRRIIGPGVRSIDQDDNCTAFEPGAPGHGDCESDGHYMCLECELLSLAELRRRRGVCPDCGSKFFPGPYGSYCRNCD